MSRLRFTAKNILSGYIFNTVSTLLRFVSRTVFVLYLSAEYLGVNGLLASVLGVLSFAELGFGTAMNYSLYKPIADNDTEKIKSLMHFYKNAYRIVAVVVTVIGLAIFPFLNVIVKDPGDVGNISTYYLVFLFNTVTSYFVSYKFCIVNAEQKNYIFSYIRTISTTLTTVLQIIVLVVFKNFLIYLLTAAAVELIQKVFITIYLNKKYPYLLDKDIQKLPKEELGTIRKNVKALVWHKIGEISVYQTDNIIISAFINVLTVGYLSNYNLVITSVSGFITIIFKSATASLGNLIATEDVEKQYYIFKIYRFLAFWLYGFSAIAFFVLLSPFIILWFGNEMVVSEIVVLLIVINHYMVGHRTCITNLKIAGGVFDQDKFVAFLQAIVNIAVSIIMVKLIGLPGVFVGTIVQGLLSSTIKPFIVYKHIFKMNVKYYFIDGFKYAMVVLISGILCWIIRLGVLSTITIYSFIVMALIVTVIPNGIFWLFYRNHEGLAYLKNVYANIKRRNK